MFVFPGNLKAARERKGISRAELARQIDMTPQGYGKYELGQGQPDLQTLVIIANILNVSIDDLLGHKIDPLQWAFDFAKSCGLDVLSADKVNDLVHSTMLRGTYFGGTVAAYMAARKEKTLFFIFTGATGAAKLEFVSVYESEQEFIAAMRQLESELLEDMASQAPKKAPEILLRKSGRESKNLWADWLI